MLLAFHGLKRGGLRTVRLMMRFQVCVWVLLGGANPCSFLGCPYLLHPPMGRCKETKANRVGTQTKHIQLSIVAAPGAARFLQQGLLKMLRSQGFGSEGIEAEDSLVVQ